MRVRSAYFGSAYGDMVDDSFSSITQDSAEPQTVWQVQDRVAEGRQWVWRVGTGLFGGQYEGYPNYAMHVVREIEP